MGLSQGQQQAAGILAAIAVAGLLYILVFNKSEGGVTCYATASSVAIVAAGIRKADTTEAIITAAGAGFLADKCDDWVKTLVEDPDKNTDLKVESETGAPVDTTVSGSQFSLPAPPTPTPDPNTPLNRLIACWRYKLELLQQWCIDGTIEPPPPSFSPQLSL